MNWNVLSIRICSCRCCIFLSPQNSQRLPKKTIASLLPGVRCLLPKLHAEAIPEFYVLGGCLATTELLDIGKRKSWGCLAWFGQGKCTPSSWEKWQDYIEVLICMWWGWFWKPKAGKCPTLWSSQGLLAAASDHANWKTLVCWCCFAWANLCHRRATGGSRSEYCREIWCWHSPLGSFAWHAKLQGSMCRSSLWFLSLCPWWLSTWCPFGCCRTLRCQRSWMGIFVRYAL